MSRKMHRKAGPPAGLTAGEDLPALLQALRKSYPLKNLYRQGWLRKLPPSVCESVADHSYFTALLGWWLAEQYFPELDLLRVLKMALLHDLPEALAGDATPADNLSSSQKQMQERQALKEITAALPHQAELMALWEEFEQGETPEARFLRQVDKLEMALQAGVYEEQEAIDLQEFFRSAGEALTAPELKKLLQSLPRRFTYQNPADSEDRSSE